jgi:four helix bundle protein
MITDDCSKFPKSAASKVITDQIIRSTGSISALIAEGVGRGGINELIRYLIMSRGSLVESQNWLMKIKKLGWIDNDRFKLYMKNFAEVRIQINALIGKLRKNKKLIL